MHQDATPVTVGASKRTAANLPAQDHLR